jgi:hypothetical protein
MIRKTQHAGTNYKFFKPFLTAAENAGGHIHFIAPGFMDLVIEDLCYNDDMGNKVFSVSHYGKQNGDLMADPDMEIAVDEKEKRIIPRTFRNDYLGIMQEVFCVVDGQKCYRRRLMVDLDCFLWEWSKNLEMQGFTVENVA